MGRPGGHAKPALSARVDRLPGLWLAIALSLHAPAYATEIAGNSKRTLAIGVIAHDRGPAGDHHEDGIDINHEVR